MFCITHCTSRGSVGIELRLSS